MPDANIFEVIPADLPLRIIDIGAMALQGENTAYHGLLSHVGTEVIGFEPDVEQCEILNSKAQGNMKFYPYFIGDGSRRKFHITNTRMTSSLYEPNMELLSKFNHLANLVQTVAIEDVQTTRLDDLKEMIPDVDLFKIDVQGASLDVFRGAPELLKQAVAIQTEVEFLPLYKNQPLFAEVDQHLRAAGFSFVRFSGLCGRCYAPFRMNNNNWDYMCQAMWTDAFYVRDIMRLTEVPPEKLLRLAAILHANYRYFDLAHTVLQAYDQVTSQTLAPTYMKKILP